MQETRTRTYSVGSRGDRALAEILRQLQSRAFRIGGMAGVVWGIAAAVLWTLGGVWLDLVLQLSPALRIAVLLSAGGVGGAVFWRQLSLGTLRGARDWLARRLDEVAGTGGQIASGVDLAVSSNVFAYSSQPALSSGLAQLAIRRATQLARRVSHAAALPSRAVNRSLATLGGIAAVLLILAVAMPNLTATEFRRFADPFGDHPPFSTITFTVEPGDTRVTYGAGLDIRATVSGPAVDDLELVLRPSEPDRSTRTPAAGGAAAGDEEFVPMFPDAPGEWRASISNVTRPAAYYVRTRNARSRRFRIDVITVPQIAEVAVRVVPPAYTHLPPYEGPVPSAGLSGLPGTEITLSARSNRPLSRGAVRVIAGDEQREVPLLPPSEGSDTVAGTFSIAGSGRIELNVYDVAGQISTEEWSTPITELADEVPFVRMIEPKPVSFATPTAVIPVVVSAEDDFGISRLLLFRNLNESRFLPEPLPVADPPPRRVYQSTRLPLELYGLEPGDEIKLFARVEDNDPRPRKEGDGPLVTGKGSESAIVVIRIISHEQFEQMRASREGMETLLAKYQQARRRMESLAEELETLRKELREQSPDEASDESRRELLEHLARRLKEEAEALHKLSEKKHPLAIDKVLNPELQKMSESLQRLQKRAESLAQQPQLTPEELEQALEQLAAELRGDRERLDQEATTPLETLAAVVRLAQDESRFVALYRRQRDLADRLASLKDQQQVSDPAVKSRMRDLEEEQRRIRIELDNLLSDIEEHAVKLPEDEDLDDLRETAQAFVKELRESGAAEEMTDAEEQLASFSGKSAHSAAKEAADILEQFLSKCEGMGKEGVKGACRKRFAPGMSDAMQKTIDQLLQGMSGMPGQGAAGDGQGGYSARRANVGLYGESPLVDGSPESGGGGDRDSQAQSGRGGAGRGDRSDEDTAHDVEGKLRATGANEAAVPLRYRRQVGRYFQRVADELGDN